MKLSSLAMAGLALGAVLPIGCSGFEDGGNGGESSGSTSTTTTMSTATGTGQGTSSSSSGNGGTGGGPPGQATVHVVYEDGTPVSGVAILAFDDAGTLGDRGVTASDGSLSIVIPPDGSVAAAAGVPFPDALNLVMVAYGVADSVTFVVGGWNPTQPTVGIGVMAPAAAEPAEWYVSCEGQQTATGNVIPNYRGCLNEPTFDVLGLHRTSGNIVSAGIVKNVDRTSPTSAAGLVPIDPANVAPMQVVATVESHFGDYYETQIGFSSGHWIYSDENSLGASGGTINTSRVRPTNVFDEFVVGQQFQDSATGDTRYRYVSALSSLPQWNGSDLALPEEPIIDYSGATHTVEVTLDSGTVGDALRVRLSQGSNHFVFALPASDHLTFAIPTLPADLASFDLSTPDGSGLVEVFDERRSAGSYSGYLGGGVIDLFGRYVRDLEGVGHASFF